MTIDEILNEIIKKEGGFVNHKNDRGGPTNMGITIGTLSKYLGRPATIEEVRNLTVDQVKEIYERKYWSDPRLNTLPEGVGPIALDMAVLFGPNRAIRFMQSVVNQAGFGPVDADGVIGPQTREAITKAYAEMGPYFINALVEERINFHNWRVQQDPSQEVFLKGWINRANSFRIAT